MSFFVMMPGIGFNLRDRYRFWRIQPVSFRVRAIMLYKVSVVMAKKTAAIKSPFQYPVY